MGLLRTIRRGATLVTVGVAGGAAIVTVRHLLRSPQPLESVLRGETHIDRKHGGDVFYNVKGPAKAPALVLLHDFYPGASNFEFRAVFEALAHDARVYAPDWLGFGMSERPNLAYTGEFYASTLAGFLRDVVGCPATVVAHGLAANVAVRAASDAPQLFERLVLVSPALTAGEGEEPTLGQVVAQTAHRFWLGLVPYALISTRPVLKRLAGGPTADEERVDHLYASAHQFGGHFAPLALLSGDLDLAIRNALPLLEPPLLLVSGEQDARRPREAMEDLAVLNPHADLDVIARAGELVFEDQPGAFVAALTSWMGTAAERHLVDESALLPPLHEAEAQADTSGEALVGTPGYVVPGVSDMGLDGPAAVTVNGVGNIAPDASSTVDEAAASGANNGDTDGEDIASISDLLPEAGAAGPGDADEDAVENIADEVIDERQETPTAPRRVARAERTSAAPESEPVPELRTRAAARTNGRAVSQRSVNVRRPGSLKALDGTTRSGAARRGAGNANSQKGGTQNGSGTSTRRARGETTE